MSGSRIKCKENSFVAFELENIEEREDISIKSAIKIRAKSQLKGRLQKSRKFVVRDIEREWGGVAKEVTSHLMFPKESRKHHHRHDRSNRQLIEKLSVRSFEIEETKYLF